MIILVGTGHVFSLSSQIERIIYEKNPDIVCVELDENRYRALLVRREGKTAKQSEEVPILYKVLAKFQDTAAKWYNVHAGDEMLSALDTAKRLGIPYVFIDRDAQQVFRELWRKMTIREKFRLFFGSILGLLTTKKVLEREFEKMQSNYDSLLENLSRRFPTIKTILIDERNTFMVDRLTELTANYSTIVAIVGDGHIPGINKSLEEKGIEVETIRLKDLIKSDNDSTARFTVIYKSHMGP